MIGKTFKLKKNWADIPGIPLNNVMLETTRVKVIRKYKSMFWKNCYYCEAWDRNKIIPCIIDQEHYIFSEAWFKKSNRWL